MAGGGIAAAITALKNNRAMLRKRNLKGKEDVYGQSGVTKLNLKESTEQDMKRIRKKIKQYKREEQIAWVITFCVTGLIVYFLYVWMTQ